ncbi:hypothetical protein T4A_2108 [Trichinella pseudospiralis]|uniref:Uncharacterized protein n=2 Tax=Trichinella pseudospiralis TaxID=6337 RepID=A0A0V1E3W6_TRIPS|nr:hypothetical protein T4A_2108 [Trichinella pseudospiralis]
MKIFVEYDSKIVQLNVPTHMTVSELVKLSKEEFGITGPNYTLFFNRTDKVGDLGASLSSAGIIENMRLLLDKSAEVEKCSLTGGESEQLKNAVNSLLQGNCNSFEFLIEVTNAIFLQKHFKVPSDGPVLAPDWKEKANADGIVRMNYVHPENSGKFEVVAIWFGRQSNHQFVEFVASNAFNNDCTPIRFTVKNLPDITSDNIAYLRVKPLIDHLLTELVEKIKDNHGPIFNVDDHIMEEILKHLSLEDFISFTRTCNWFRRCWYFPSLWKFFLYRDFQVVESDCPFEHYRWRYFSRKMGLTILMYCDAYQWRDNARGLSSSFPFFGTGGPDDLNPLGGGIPRMPNIFPDYNEPPSFMGPLAPHGNRPRGPRYDPPFPYDTQGQIRLPRPGRGGPPSGYGNYFI